MKTDYVVAVLFGFILIIGGLMLDPVIRRIHSYGVVSFGTGVAWGCIIPIGVVLIIFGLLAYYTGREEARQSSPEPAQ